jgi:hypothetical protein
LGSNPHSVTNIKVPCESDLSTQLNTVSDLATSRDTSLRNDYAPFSNSDVVPDLYQIINPRPGANNRVRPGAAIYRAVCTDFNMILNQDSPELRDSHRTD